LTTVFPDLDAAFLDSIRDYTAGDPMRPRMRWTNLSLRALRKKLIERGFRVGREAVTALLRRHRFGRRQAQKKMSTKRHPHRDKQFCIIAQLRRDYENSANRLCHELQAFPKKLARTGRNQGLSGAPVGETILNKYLYKINSWQSRGKAK
jgi:hypothetical protein